MVFSFHLIKITLLSLFLKKETDLKVLRVVVQSTPLGSISLGFPTCFCFCKSQKLTKRPKATSAFVQKQLLLQYKSKSTFPLLSPAFGAKNYPPAIDYVCTTSFFSSFFSLVFPSRMRLVPNPGRRHRSFWAAVARLRSRCPSLAT